MNTVSRTCRTISKVSLKSQREERLLQKKIFEEITAKSAPSLVKGKNLQIQKAQQTPNRIKANKKTWPTDIKIKLLKIRDLKS